MARTSRILASLLLAAGLVPAPLAAGNWPAKPASAVKAGQAAKPAKATWGLSPTKALLLLPLFLTPAAGAGGAPAAPAGGPGLVPLADPGLASPAAYMDICPLVVRDSFYDQRNHCTTDPDPVENLDGDKAARVAEAMNMPWLVEEMVLSANTRALDLADCVCRAYRVHEQSQGELEQRDKLLYERLLATKVQRDALGKAIWDFKQVIFKIWDRLSREPELWVVPEDWDEAAQPALEVPWPERVDQLKEMVRTLEAAKDQWDATVKPRQDQLKQHLKQLAKARAAKEAYDTTVIPTLQALKGKLKDPGK